MDLIFCHARIFKHLKRVLNLPEAKFVFTLDCFKGHAFDANDIIYIDKVSLNLESEKCKEIGEFIKFRNLTTKEIKE